VALRVTTGLLISLACLTCYSHCALGQFETPASVAISAEPFAIAVGDFNNDGKLDLAVTAAYTSRVAVLLGSGDGTFKPAAYYSVGREPFSIAAASFRKNGVLDLVVASDLDPFVYVLLGNGDGTFQDAVPYPALGGGTGVSTGNFTGNGKVDIVALTENSQTCICISVYPGNGDGTFQPAVTTPVPYNVGALALAPGYFNSDKKLDLVTVGFFGGANQADILLGNGDDTFQPNGFYSVSSEPESVVVADFNSDKKADLAVGNFLGSSISVLLGNGDGTFQQAVSYRTPFPTSVLAADFDGDGKLDLAASSPQLPGPAGVTVLRGNGNGTFQSGVLYSAGLSIQFVASGDFNGDHQPDLVLADYLGGSVITLLNTGVVSFSPTTPVSFPFQLFNTTSPPQTVTLTNTGTTALTISSMKATGQFGLSSACGSSVAAGATCDLNVTFSPRSKGPKAGTISIVDSASTKPQVIELSGQGTVVQLTPASLTFGPQKVGTKSAPQSVTLTNQGTTALSITKISVSGANAKDFSETNGCPASLNAGGVCTITVTFDPTKTGTHKAQVSITDNGGGSPQSVPLSGTGS